MVAILGSKLIWQQIAPAPFESAWSIFAKLLALNTISPQKLRSIIVAHARTSTTKEKLDFRNSDWIDFSNFGSLLGINEGRLRTAFLDQLGFVGNNSNAHKWSQPGIKICHDCLAKGYHCVFFELGFIDTCPWHHKRLEIPCDSCTMTVSSTGLKKRRDKSIANQSFQEEDYQELSSSCGHIYFSMSCVKKLNMLSPEEEKAINSQCAALLFWWKSVSKNPEIASFLSRYSFPQENESHLRAILGAAELIAGKCPWPVGITRGPKRTQRWVEATCKVDNFIYDIAPRSSEWDMAYRSVRRHIFRRYVRQHRDCWKELTNYRRYDAGNLDSDTCCPVALAFAVWTMHLEQLRTIDAFSSEKLRNHSIRVMTLRWPRIGNSLRTHTSLLYAYFFQIWDAILGHIGDDDFAIVDSDTPWNLDFLTVLYSHGQNHLCTPANNCEWTLIFGEPEHLLKQSFLRCCGRRKSKYWMIYSQLQEHWTDIYWPNDTGYMHTLFKLRKYKLGRRRASFKYITI